MTGEKAKEFVLVNAIASVEFEGYKLSGSDKELCAEFLSGKLDSDSFVKNVVERALV